MSQSKLEKYKSLVTEIEKINVKENNISGFIDKLSQIDTIKGIYIDLLYNSNSIIGKTDHLGINLSEYIETVNLELIKVLNKRLRKLRALKRKLETKLYRGGN